MQKTFSLKKLKDTIQFLRNLYENSNTTMLHTKPRKTTRLLFDFTDRGGQPAFCLSVILKLSEMVILILCCHSYNVKFRVKKLIL